MTTPQPLSATIVITTKNRKEDLRRAIRSSLSQFGSPEVLVIDDGSTDGTSEMVAAEFPAVRLVRHETSTGYIKARNEAAGLAQGDVIFSIDDDAEYSGPHVVAQTLSEFSDPLIAAIAIPFVDVNRDPTVRQRALNSEEIWITDRFIGTAHAIRRNIFLQLGGYRDLYFHQGEERDLCIRMLDAGYTVRLGTAELIHHYESPRRETKRMDLYGRRNDVLYVWLNVPTKSLPVTLLATALNGLVFGCQVGRPLRMFRGVCRGVGASVKYWSIRRPVRDKTNQLFRRLQKNQQTRFQDVREHLGTM